MNIENKTGLVWPACLLFFRTISFYAVGLVLVLVISLLGHPHPWQEVTRWWTYQVIVTNGICFLVLAYLQRKAGERFSGLYRFTRAMMKRDILIILALIIPSGIIGYYSVVIAGQIFYGSNPPEFMMQSLPIAAAVASVVLFPLSNALIETTTYFGYSFEGLVKGGLPIALALLVASLCLAMQHIAIPLFLDGKYIVWRIVSFLPFALFVGLVYAKIRRLVPIVVLHYLADLPLAIITLVLSMKP